MAFRRTSIRLFSIANNAYKDATVTFYTVDDDGVRTTTLGTLYEAPTGTGTLANPQTLDSTGKFSAPVYADVPLIAAITGSSVDNHETGVIYPSLSTADVTTASDAATAAAAAQTAAETAETNAETAQTAAEAAQAAAEAAVGTVKVSSNDTTSKTLSEKLVAGTGISLTEGSDGGDEDLTIATDRVAGPASATDNALVRFDATTGKLVQNSAILVDDNGSAYGGSARENNIGSTGSNVTLDMSAYNVWYFEPTGNIDVDVTNVPAIGSGAVLGYAVITGGGDHTLTLKCEGSTGGALTPGGSGLTLSTGTDKDIVKIIKTGTDEVCFAVSEAALA